MRKTVLLFLVIFTSISVRSQKVLPDTILLFHPTVSNINTLSYLLENDILHPGNFHFKGVYHVKAEYEYSESSDYLAKHPQLPFSLYAISNDLPGNMIFTENSCSPIFKKLFMHSEGAIFLGGPDIPPSTYNESMHLLTRVSDPARHYLELSYLFHILGAKQNPLHMAYMKHKPEYGVLGI